MSLNSSPSPTTADRPHLNERCATTLKLNGFTNVVNGLLEHSDLSQYHGADLLTAGPPCQPWSIGGRSLGEEDSRNLWAATVRAIRGIQPKAFLIEMVDGFLRPKFDTARWQLTADLQALGYHVQISKVNAKDYGVPQYRRRCLIMGRRSLLPIRLPKAKPPITCDHLTAPVTSGLPHTCEAQGCRHGRDRQAAQGGPDRAQHE